MATGWLHDERYLWHDSRSWSDWLPPAGAFEPEPSPESPQSKRRFASLVRVSGLERELVRLDPRPATEQEVLRLHTAAYVERIRSESAAAGGEAGDGTPFGRGSYEIALLAAGGCIVACEAVLDGVVQNAYALVRPPGHHAEAGRGRGFCLFGNVAIAVRHLRAVRGLERVAIVDWDVHHGNGSESAFYDDASVLTISLHQDDLYPPGRGRVEDVGEGAGRGFNVNVPLPAGAGRAAYELALERVVVPALRSFGPQLVIVASGLDASAYDPLARMSLTAACYRRLTRTLLDAADELCGGRLVLCHEGGYSSMYVPYCGLAIVEELAGVRTAVEDPMFAAEGDPSRAPLRAHERDAVEAAAAAALSLRGSA